MKSTEKIYFDTHFHSNNPSSFGVYQFDIESNETIHSFYSVGIHPMNSTVENLNAFLQNFSIQPNLKAIGECGLDSRFANLNTQEIVFIEQIKIAQINKLPIILHCVNQIDRCLYLFHQNSIDIPLIFHGFSKSSQLESVLKNERVYLSYGEKLINDIQLQKAFILTPIDRILLETDNSEKSISEIYTFASDLKNLPLHDFSEIIFQNAKRIFKL